MKVVLVEDSTLIATQLLERLSREPNMHVVGHATCEDEAVKLIEVSQPDAVILDLVLQPGSGLGVIRRIRDAGSQVQILVLTNLTHPMVRGACVGAGVAGFFDKHTEIEQCLDALKGLL